MWKASLLGVALFGAVSMAGAGAAQAQWGTGWGGVGGVGFGPAVSVSVGRGFYGPGWGLYPPPRYGLYGPAFGPGFGPGFGPAFGPAFGPSYGYNQVRVRSSYYGGRPPAYRGYPSSARYRSTYSNRGCW
jgi:hypothetical protein